MTEFFTAIESNLNQLKPIDQLAYAMVLKGLSEVLELEGDCDDPIDVRRAILTVFLQCPFTRPSFLPFIPKFGDIRAGIGDPDDPLPSAEDIYECLRLIRNRSVEKSGPSLDEIAMAVLNSPPADVNSQPHTNHPTATESEMQS